MRVVSLRLTITIPENKRRTYEEMVEVQNTIVKFIKTNIPNSRIEKCIIDTLMNKVILTVGKIPFVENNLNIYEVSKLLPYEKLLSISNSYEDNTPLGKGVVGAFGSKKTSSRRKTSVRKSRRKTSVRKSRRKTSSRRKSR